jgi:hypothetical protein
MWTLVMFISGALLLLWSWNSVVSGIFWLPTLQLKQALALEALLGVLYFPVIAMRLWGVEIHVARKGADS